MPRGSPNCWSHRKSPRGAHSGVHLGHLQGEMERVGRLSVSVRVPRDSGPKLLPFREAWTRPHSWAVVTALMGLRPA